jgi:RNA polymerase sigma-70 factor (ECF subfamily)
MPLIAVPPDDRGFDLEAELASHHAAAWGWALACCRWDADQAADVLQTAYLRIVEGSARFGGQSAFRTWLFGVIRRVAAGERRRALLRRMVPLGLPGGAEPEDGARRADLALADDETIGLLRDALGALPERQREVLHLVFYQELTIEEAGAVMGVSLGTARTHYERGKAALRRRLGPGLRLHA